MQIYKGKEFVESRNLQGKKSWLNRLTFDYRMVSPTLNWLKAPDLNLFREKPVISYIAFFFYSRTIYEFQQKQANVV